MKRKRIVVTRSPHQAAELGKKLLDIRKAKPLFYPFY